MRTIVRGGSKKTVTSVTPEKYLFYSFILDSTELIPVTAKVSRVTLFTL